MIALSTKDSRKLDQQMISQGYPSVVLMENAAKAVYDQVVADFPDQNTKIVVLCGTGNNGGDGLAVARWLINHHYPTEVIMVGSRSKLSVDAKFQLDLLSRLVESMPVEWVELEAERVSLGSAGAAELLLDGLFGTGLDRDLEPAYIRLIEAVNQLPAVKLAIDIPSGINGDTGRPMPVAIKADKTVTFGYPKIGQLLYPAVDFVGQLVVADIGIFRKYESMIKQPIRVLDSRVLAQQCAYLSRKSDGHKADFGKVGIIAGSPNMLGATMLSAKSCYRAGAGLVKVFIDQKEALFFNAAVVECITVTADQEREGIDETTLTDFIADCDVILVGPGLEDQPKNHRLLERLLTSQIRLVLDAGALNILSRQPQLMDLLHANCVITPHIGEMARLAQTGTSQVLADPIGFCNRFAKRYQLVCVLKSASTIIAAGDPSQGQNEKDTDLPEPIFINTTGNSGMATAGSGDVLSGVIAGLIGQSVGNKEAALIGVMLHSAAGDRFAAERGQHCLMASDLIDYLWR